MSRVRRRHNVVFRFKVRVLQNLDSLLESVRRLRIITMHHANEVIHHAAILLSPAYESTLKEESTVCGIAPLFRGLQHHEEHAGREMVHDRLELLKVDLVVTTLKEQKQRYSEISKKWNMNLSRSWSLPNMHCWIPFLNSVQQIFSSRLSSNMLNRRSTLHGGRKRPTSEKTRRIEEFEEILLQDVSFITACLRQGLLVSADHRNLP